MQEGISKPVSLNKTTKEFKTLFLLEFTRQLIRHSASTEIFELENIIKDEDKNSKKDIYDNIKEKIQQRPFPIPSPQVIRRPPMITRPRISPAHIMGKRPVTRMSPPASQGIRIPEPVLPKDLQYLKPLPTKANIDLGRLNPLIQDPLIRAIECNGPDENIIITRTRDTKRTDIVLNKTEIDEIINKFSEASRIPLQEGVFKVAVGNLVMLAIISNIISSKFIIKKIMYNPFLRR